MSAPRETDIRIEEIGNGYLLTLGGYKLFADTPEAAGERVMLHLRVCKAREEAEIARLEKRFGVEEKRIEDDDI